MAIPGVHARFQAAKACFHRAQLGGMQGNTDTSKLVDAIDNLGRGLEALAQALEQQSPIAQREAGKARRLSPSFKRPKL
jgi:hypothetical protein